MPCKTFQKLSRDTWQLMQNRFKTPISIREDAITSLNLMHIYNNLAGHVKVLEFSPHEEGRVSGADWEWWFLSKKGAFGAAVQAKCIDANQEYDVGYISCKSTKPYPQIERLLDYSIANSISPMYCFYNWFSATKITFPWSCSLSKKRELWGCAIADGWTVYAQHLANQYSANHYRKFCEPWHCLTCCTPSGAELGTRTRNVTKRIINKGKAISGDDYPTQYKDADVPPLKVHDALPARVLELIQVGRRQGEEIALREYDENTPKRLVLIGDIERFL